jgi:hypothetical protein
MTELRQRSELDAGVEESKRELESEGRGVGVIGDPWGFI